MISDAGTPLLSDPGFPLVRAVREAGLPVFAAPGASALLAALAVAGLPADAFSFLGFLPPKTEGRENALRELAGRRETLVFYESPRRLGRCACRDGESLRRGASGRSVALELTKKFERVFRGPVGDLAAQFGEGRDQGRGGDPRRRRDRRGGRCQTSWHAALGEAMTDQPLRAAVDEIATRFSLKRKDVYDAALALKAQQ